MVKKGVIINILGRRGSGKSTKTKTAVLYREYDLPESPDLVVILDLMEEYDPVEFVGRMVPDIYTFIDLCKKDPWGETLILQFDDLEKQFNNICRLVNYLGKIRLKKTGKIIFVVEEVDTYCKPGWSPEHFSLMIKKGRHWGISVVSNSRRPAEFPKLLTSQSDTLISFSMNDEADVKYINSYCKALKQDVPDILRNLGEFEYMKYDANKRVLKIFKDP